MLPNSKYGTCSHPEILIKIKFLNKINARVLVRSHTLSLFKLKEKLVRSVILTCLKSLNLV